MAGRQATFGEYGRNTQNTPDFPPVGRDEWGPTMRRPVPVEEASRTADDAAMRARGHDPDGCRDEAYSPGDYHRDDAEPRPDYEATMAEMHEQATGETPIMHDTTDATDTDSSDVLDVLNSLPDGDAFREQMAEHGEEMAADGGQAAADGDDFDPYDRPAVWNAREMFDADGPAAAIGADDWDRQQWHNVDAPESLPADRQAQVIDLAERLLRAPGVRTGFGHHEEIRRSMEQWAPDRGDDDPDDRRRWVFQMGPGERNMGKLGGDATEREGKARTVIAWARSEMPADVFDDIAEQQLEDAREKWRKAAEEARTADAVEAFRADPPDQLNGWVRFESSKPDVLLAYAGENHGTPSVAAIYETPDGLDAHESTLAEWNDAPTGADAKVNRHFVRPSRGEIDAHRDLRRHLRTFDAEPLEGHPEAVTDVPEQVGDYVYHNASPPGVRVWSTQRGPHKRVNVVKERGPASGWEVVIEGEGAIADGLTEHRAVERAVAWMEGHQHQPAADGGHPSAGLPDNWTATAPESTEKGSRFFLVKGYFLNAFGTEHEKAIIVYRPHDADDTGWLAKSGKGFGDAGRETITFGGGTAAEASRAAIEAARQANAEWTDADGFELGEPPEHVATPAENVAAFEAERVEPAPAPATDGGQAVAAEAPDEPDFAESWGFDAEAETVTEDAIGGFVHSSWGYGQTNVEMAQIVGVSDSGKTVRCRMVAPHVEHGSHGSDSVSPRTDPEPYGDTFRMHVRGGYKGGPKLRGSYPYIDGEMDTGTRMGNLYPIDPDDSAHQTQHGYRH